MNALKLATIISDVVQDVFDVSLEPVVTRPDEQFGDFATNVALQLAARLGKNPREVAGQLAQVLREHAPEHIKNVSIAGPGFINITLSDKTLIHVLNEPAAQPLTGQEILTEFGDPNPFKAMHLGHLYTTIAGDAISHLLERAGAKVKRLGYHGDVGLHVAKALWALLQDSGDVTIGTMYISAAYARGATAYKENPQAKSEIEDINRQIYEYRLEGKADNPRLAKLYDIGFAKSFEGFDAVFKQLGVKYVRHYLESESTKAGLQYVKENTGNVFEESEGAIVYKGEKAGLHTRVFINSRGLPTYEAKDLGLAELKARDYPNAAQSIIITAAEQSEYFKVMLAALNEIDPNIAQKTKHISHGYLSLTGGKMSSRTGIELSQTAAYLLGAIKEAVALQFADTETVAQEAVYLAALKYTFLRSRIGGDIVFNVEESVALEGNSGPYIQYAHARARSILRKAGSTGSLKDAQGLEAGERSLARKMSEFPEALARATTELMPHHICTYLFELAHAFNRFYEQNRVLGDPREAPRLALITCYADTLKDGLSVLGIGAPDQL